MEASTHSRANRRTSKSVSVWYLPDDLSRIEQAAALAGYKNLSTFVREKSLNRARYDQSPRTDVLGLVGQDELHDQMARLEAGQVTLQTLLSMVLALLAKKSTTDELADLVSACERADAPGDILQARMPTLSAALDRLEGISR
jgi:hypothetical protein